MDTRILVVDDDQVIRRLLRVNLELDGFTVLEAANAEEGLAVIKGQRPAAVILDIMLPGVSGLELLREIRSHAELGDVAVILATARRRDSDIWEGWSTGADSYVTKPFDFDLLLSEIRRVTEFGAERFTKSSISTAGRLISV